MRKGNYECLELPWDTEYFGVSSARVNLFGVVDDREQDVILEFCRNYTFVTITNLNNNENNNYWIGNRTTAFLADVNVQFIKKIETKSDAHDEKTYITNNLPFNNQILEISRKSFKYSRFFNDPNISSFKSENVYSHWSESAFNQENKYFVINENEGKISGFAIINYSDIRCQIELIAVNEIKQGLGIGRLLISKIVDYLTRLNLRELTVGTQINNVQAVNFYLENGFDFSACNSIYHLWVK